MSDLLWQSKWWRYIVYRTKGNPKAMAVVSVSCIASFLGLAWIAQESTERLKTPLSELKETNISQREQQQYAKAGQAAFATLVLSTVGPENLSEEDASKATVPLPPIAWHPKAIEREKKRQERENSSAISGK
eukprot:jgi/Galph1/3000/GphlegSOOS_G1698.1